MGDQDTLTLLLNSVDQPAQDPLGLTREQFDADPYQTTPQAILFDTRKTSAQTQGGGTWRHRFADAGALRESALTLYAGQRDVTQWQAIPVATQANPRHPGGVIDFGRDYLRRSTRAWCGAGRTQSLIAGVATERQSEDRRGYENFTRQRRRPAARRDRRAAPPGIEQRAHAATCTCRARSNSRPRSAPRSACAAGA